MFSKVLIANRGEIAVRIMQTCRELNVKTVAVYSEVDEVALHVRMADESRFIGAAPARVSYLDAPRLIQAGLDSGAEAIHPGYGFLAENAAFARAVTDAGLVWVGPPAPVIALLGDKTAAKRVAETAGVPVIPGYSGTDLSVAALRDAAADIGYPVMLKAAAGGGGKGMRIVEREGDLAESVEAARREASAAFGDDRVFLEKLLHRPRHIEIQVLADSFGRVIYLGDRDCSLQRRHQKVIEESPGYSMTTALHSAMGEAAVRLASACQYVNAGTVEFLSAGEEFYFLEVNTRIQVEHPVTEETTGLDLVRLQLEIAAGTRLSLTQADVTQRGHAIEARIYAEDAALGFLPSTGTVQALVQPGGPGIRNDTGVESGDAITMHYDPMVAKLIVHAETRPLAVARLQNALQRYACSGLQTNLPFLRWLVSEPAFVAGEVDITFIDRAWQPGGELDTPVEVLIAIALMDSTPHDLNGDPWRASSNWRTVGATRRLRYQRDRDQFQLDVLPLGSRHWRMTVFDHERDVWLVDSRGGRVIFTVNGVMTNVAMTRIPGGYSLMCGSSTYELTHPQQIASRTRRSSDTVFEASLLAPMPGVVSAVLVTTGQNVETGTPLVLLEAMKMEHVVRATSDATVKAILVQTGDMVAAGAVLVEMEL